MSIFHLCVIYMYIWIAHTCMHLCMNAVYIYVCPRTHVEVRRHPQVSPHFPFSWEGISRLALFSVCYTKPTGQRAPGWAPASLPFIMQGLYMLTLLHPVLCRLWRLDLRSSDLRSPQPGKSNPSSCFLSHVYSGCRSGSSGCLERIPLTQFIEKLLVRSLREFSIPPFRNQRRRHWN